MLVAYDAHVASAPREDDESVIAHAPNGSSILSHVRGKESVPIGIAKQFDAMYSVASALSSIGVDLYGDMHETPRRVVKMWSEMLTPDTDWTFTTFASESNELVLVRSIPFTSLCAHHLLPFTGVAHVAYIPHGLIAGLSKLPRLVKMLARAPQVQEQLTSEIASGLSFATGSPSVGVVIEARHACMEIRGVESNGAVTVTSALRGDFMTDPATRAELMGFVR